MIDKIDMDVNDLFKQTAFKVIDSNFNVNFTNDQTYESSKEMFDRFSKEVVSSFSNKLQHEFYLALVSKFHEHKNGNLDH